MLVFNELEQRKIFKKFVSQFEMHPRLNTAIMIHMILISRLRGWCICSLMLISCLDLKGQNTIDTVAVRNELVDMLDRDQKTRKRGDSLQYVQFIDSSNLHQLENLMANYGWPGISFVGAKANQAAFLIIQHAQLPAQLKYLPLFEKSVAAGESKAADLALLQDRILMRQGKPQRYGSQIVMNKEGQQEFYPIEDELNVNERRSKVGLQPIEEYARYFGIDYKPAGK